MASMTLPAKLTLIDNLMADASREGTVYHNDTSALWNLKEAVTTAVLNNPTIDRYRIVRNSLDLFADESGKHQILAYGNYCMSLVQGCELRLLVELL
jgi:hypothetical protein